MSKLNDQQSLGDFQCFYFTHTEYTAWLNMEPSHVWNFQSNPKKDVQHLLSKACLKQKHVLRCLPLKRIFITTMEQLSMTRTVHKSAIADAAAPGGIKAASVHLPS